MHFLLTRRSASLYSYSSATYRLCRMALVHSHLGRRGGLDYHWIDPPGRLASSVDASRVRAFREFVSRVRRLERDA